MSTLKEVFVLICIYMCFKDLLPLHTHTHTLSLSLPPSLSPYSVSTAASTGHCHPSHCSSLSVLPASGSVCLLSLPLPQVQSRQTLASQRGRDGAEATGREEEEGPHGERENVRDHLHTHTVDIIMAISLPLSLPPSLPSLNLSFLLSIPPFLPPSLPPPYLPLPPSPPTLPPSLSLPAQYQWSCS